MKRFIIAFVALAIGLAALTPAEASGLQGTYPRGYGYGRGYRGYYPPVRRAPVYSYAPASGGSASAAIAAASTRWGVSYGWLLRVAECESGLNSGAYNPSGASGLFQFMPGTYWLYAGRIGETRSYWDAYGSANVAAYMFSIGLSFEWTCR